MSLFAVLVSGVIGSGILDGSSGWVVNVIGMAGTVLTALGYTAARTAVKCNETTPNP